MIKTSQRMIVAGVVVALFARPSEAQPAERKADTAEIDALTDKARQLYLEGLEALKKSSWAEAHASFLAAWRIKPQYQIASNLGFSELKLGKHRDAAEHLAATTIYALATRQTTVKTGVRAAPVLTAAGGGLVVNGAW